MEGFQPISVTGDVTKVTIDAVYMMSHNGARTGYAYSVNAGKAVKTDVTFSVAYIVYFSQETVTGFRPYNINVTVACASCYVNNIFA